MKSVLSAIKHHSVSIVLGSVIGLGVGLIWLGLQTRSSPAPTLSTPDTTGTLQGSVSMSSSSALTVGLPAPDFTLKTLDGDQVSLSEFRGQSVLINFWASWCGPCRREMPDLVRAYETYQDDGFMLLGINLTFQDSLPDVQAFVDEFDMTFPILLDETGDVTLDKYQLIGLPMSIFVDREGLIDRVQIGPMTGEQIDAFVTELLK